MAQNIQIAGATFNAVPSIVVPVAGGGSATFVDPSPTTAAAADVANGKLFFDALGVLTQGTASGGASNVVTGTFTTGATGGVAQSVTIPYTGNGHPVFIGVFPNDGYATGSSLYGITHQYATIEIAITRSNVTFDPNYSGSGSNNQGYVSVLYKGSSTTNTGVSRTNGAAIFTSSAADSGVGTTVRFSAKDKMSIFVSSNSYGFLASTTYRYVIVYSS